MTTEQRDNILSSFEHAMPVESGMYSPRQCSWPDPPKAYPAVLIDKYARKDFEDAYGSDFTFAQLGVDTLVVY